MEEKKENTNNAKSQDNEAIKKIADFVDSKDLTPKQVEEKIDEALKKCYKLIESKVTDYLPVNGDVAEKNRVIANLQNNAKLDMFNRVLSEGIDNIDVLYQTIAVDAIKPIVPVEDKDKKTLSKEELRKAELNRYIEKSFEEHFEKSDLKDEESIKKVAFQFKPRNYANKKEKMEDIGNIIDEATQDIEDELNDLLKKANSKDINELELDDKNVIALSLMAKGIRDISIYSGMKFPDSEKTLPLADMVAIAAELNPNNEYNDKYIAILNNLSEVTGIDIYEKMEDGTYALDDNGAKVISPEKILNQFNKSLEGVMPRKSLDDIRKNNKEFAGALFGDEIPKTLGELKEKIEEMAKSMVKEGNFQVEPNISEITDTLFNGEQTRNIEITGSLVSSVINATKDIAIYSGNESLEPQEKSHIAKDMCYLAMQENAIADNYIIKLSKILGDDAKGLIETDKNGKTVIKKDEILKYYRSIDEKEYSKIAGEPVSLEDNEEYSFEHLKKDLEAQKKYDRKLPENYIEMKKLAEKMSNQHMFLDLLVYNYDEDNFEKQVTSLVKGNMESAQKFLKEFLEESSEIAPEFMQRFVTVGNIIKKESSMTSVKLATMGMRDLQEYDAEKINDQDRTKILKDMCILSTGDKNVTDDLLIQLADKYKIDVIEKQENGKTQVDKDKLIKMYNEYNGGSNFTIEDLKDKANFFPDQDYEKYMKEPPQNSEDILKIAKKVNTQKMVMQTLFKNDNNFDEKMGELVREDTDVAQECLSLFLESSASLTPQMQDRVIKLGKIIKENKEQSKGFPSVENADISAIVEDNGPTLTGNTQSNSDKKTGRSQEDDEPSL